jgi:hypothetical protein
VPEGTKQASVKEEVHVRHSTCSARCHHLTIQPRLPHFCLNTPVRKCWQITLLPGFFPTLHYKDLCVPRYDLEKQHWVGHLSIWPIYEGTKSCQAKFCESAASNKIDLGKRQQTKHIATGWRNQSLILKLWWSKGTCPTPICEKA